MERWWDDHMCHNSCNFFYLEKHFVIFAICSHWQISYTCTSPVLIIAYTQMIQILITPHACAGVKVIVFVIVVVVIHKKSWDLHVGTWVTHRYNESIEVGKNWLQYASNRVALSTSVTNNVFLLVIIATPINCAMHSRTMYSLLMHTT